ncbi:MAG: GGDEF domain-containing protein [Deltaproteobacteria bacterium]|nr:GGDEF domain-containing protein [Deltaproteobacteria bacterium]
MRSKPQIETIAAEEIGRFLLRYRRSDTLERVEPALDHFLREILAKANEFVPADAGAILLDEPSTKLRVDVLEPRLICIAAFGDNASSWVGGPLEAEARLIAHTYLNGRSLCTSSTGSAAWGSLLAVPVVIGTAVCGVLLLVKRQADAFSTDNRTLLEIFAGYISSSIQNALDGIRAAEAARRDHLTGLYNDRYLHYRLRELVRQSIDTGGKIGLLFIDVDDFKQINDRYGHVIGSATLRDVGTSLSCDLPRAAVAARFGGDEFVIVLEGASADQAAEIAEQARARIVETPFELAGEPACGEISVSIGVASLVLQPSGGRDASRSKGQRKDDTGPTVDRVDQLTRRLVQRADHAMYEAKATGKDRVVLADVLRD